ncbi:MAG: c-type cytochrome [Devosia sp.]
MDSFELNKIMGAVLGTLLFVMGTGFVAEAIYHPIEDNGPGYALPEPAPDAGSATAEAAAPAVPLPVLLASADATKGASVVKKCQSCHNFGEGEPSKQGPHLYGVVGRPEGSLEGFAYSDGMKEHNATGDIWTYENLNTFLTKPSAYVKGTKMAFAGISDDAQRADVLAYLQTLSHDPVPFPAADAAAAPADAAAAPTAPADTTAAPADATNPAAASAIPAPAAATPAPAAAPAATAPADAPATAPADAPASGTPAPTTN